MGYLNDKKNFINQAVITLGGRAQDYQLLVMVFQNH